MANTVKTETVKDADFVIPGVETRVWRENGSIRGIEVGGFLIGSDTSYAALRITGPAKPKLVKRFRAQIAHNGETVRVFGDFETEGEAQEALADFPERFGPNVVEVEVEEVS